MGRHFAIEPVAPNPAATSDGGRGVRPMAATRVVSAGGALVDRTDFALTHLAVRWRGPRPQVRVRLGTGWTQWTTVDGCPGGRDGRAAEGGSALLVAPGATGYELAASGAVAEVTELNTAAEAAAGPATAVLPMPDGTQWPVNFVSRAGWGADESLRFDDAGNEIWPPEYFPAQALTVHHTAGANNDPDPAATVRAIYYFQCVTEGWGDIGYHLLIDEAGVVYEGRASGGSIPVFAGPKDDGEPAHVVTAGHAFGFNAGNVGVCLLGDFTSVRPTSAAVAALTTVLAGLAYTCRLDPLGEVVYTHPQTGDTRQVNAISGHRDWLATQCPGNTFYPDLSSVRRLAHAKIRIPARRPAPWW